MPKQEKKVPPRSTAHSNHCHLMSLLLNTHVCPQKKIHHLPSFGAFCWSFSELRMCPKKVETLWPKRDKTKTTHSKQPLLITKTHGSSSSVSRSRSDRTNESGRRRFASTPVTWWPRHPEGSTPPSCCRVNHLKESNKPLISTPPRS